ncbi:MAG TPA: glycosyltransferase family 2 protein [bacterium]|nr:glycosyltransferase family 2 protein [bacterium]
MAERRRKKGPKAPAGSRKARSRTVRPSGGGPSRKKPRRLSGRIFKDLNQELPEPPFPDFPETSHLRRMEQKFEMSLARPRVSVVVAARNEVDRLWHCLFALKTQTYPPDEIILVDNASEDTTVDFVRSNYPQVKVLECQEIFGRTMAVNLGVKTAGGDLVAIVDPGVVVKPDWLQKLVTGFQANWPKFGVMASFPLGEEGKREQGGEWDQTLNFLGRPIKGYWPDERLVFCPPEGAWIYPRFLAPEGPFDEDYGWFGGAAYLGWRMRASGRFSGWNPEAKIFRSVGPGEDEPGWKRVFWSNRNRWLNLLLFLEGGNLWKIIPWMFLECAFLTLKGLVMSFSTLVGTLLAAGWILFHTKLVLEKRRVLQEKRKVPDREILGLVSGRVVSDNVPMSRLLNILSLAYCRLVGLKVLEWQ